MEVFPATGDRSGRCVPLTFSETLGCCSLLLCVLHDPLRPGAHEPAGGNICGQTHEAYK